MDGAQFGMTHGTASVGHSAPLVLVTELPSFSSFSLSPLTPLPRALTREASARQAARVVKHPSVRCLSCDRDREDRSTFGFYYPEQDATKRSRSVDRTKIRKSRKVGFKEFPTSLDGRDVEIFELDGGRLLVKKLGRLRPNELPFEIVETTKPPRCSDRPLRFDKSPPRPEQDLESKRSESFFHSKTEPEELHIKPAIAERTKTSLTYYFIKDDEIKFPKSSQIDEKTTSVRQRSSFFELGRSYAKKRWVFNYVDGEVWEDQASHGAFWMYLTRVVCALLVIFCFLCDLADTPLRLALDQPGDVDIFKTSNV